jgi:hypothetical protein
LRGGDNDEFDSTDAANVIRTDSEYEWETKTEKGEESNAKRGEEANALDAEYPTEIFFRSEWTNKGMDTRRVTSFLSFLMWRYVRFKVWRQWSWTLGHRGARRGGYDYDWYGTVVRE